MAFEHEWHSLQGTLTRDNRDYCGIAERPDATLYVVIDGATRGPCGGDLARELACHLVDQFLEMDEPFARIQISRLLQNIHAKLCRRFPADSASFFILVQTNDRQIMTAHAGDCRLGRMRPDKSVEWLSKAHTLANAVDDLSDTALIAHPNRHCLTRSFRAGRLPNPEYGEFSFLPDDTLLIATDGFWAELNSSGQTEFLEGTFTSSEKEADDKSCLILGNRVSREAIELPDQAGKSDNLYFRLKNDND